MTDEDLRGKDRVSIDSSDQLLYAALQAFHDALGDASVEGMRQYVKSVLGKVGKLGLSQLVLFDDGGSIVSAFLMTPERLGDAEAEPRLKTEEAVRRFEVEVLEEPIYLPGAEDEEKLRQAIEKLKNDRYGEEEVRLLQEKVGKNVVSIFWMSVVYADFLACVQVEDGVVNGRSKPVYEVRRLRLNGPNARGMLSQSLGEYVIPLVFDVQGCGLQPWFERLVVMGKRWPAFGQLPEISGFIIFSLSPEDGVEQRPGKQSMQDRWSQFEQRLWYLREELQRFSWLIFYAAFVFQTYALSQASAEEPRRLREEISHHDWCGILCSEADEYTQTKDQDSRKRLERSITRVLGLESEFVKRKILRDIAAYALTRPDVARILRNQVATFIRALSPTNSDSVSQSLEYIKAAYESISGASNTLDSENGLVERVLLSAFRHVGILYAFMQKDTLTAYLTEEVLPTITELLSEPYPPNAVRTRDSLKEVIKYNLALAALEDAFVEADNKTKEKQKACEMQEPRELLDLQDLLVDRLLGMSLPADNPMLHERLAGSLMVLCGRIGKQRDERITAIQERIVELLSCLADRSVARFTIVNRVFALLDSDSRRNIVEPLSKRSTGSFLLDELNRVDRRLISLESGKGTAAKALDGTEPISVMSTKGGVGKSLIAMGLAAVAARLSDRRVCLIDLDFFGPTVEYMVHTSIDRGQLSFNEYLWATLYDRIEESTRIRVFEGRCRRNWRCHIEGLSELDNQVLIDAMLDHSNRLMPDIPNVDFICCSTDPTLQDLMLPLLLSGEASQLIQDKLVGHLA